MARKHRLSKAARERRREQHEKEHHDLIVRDTVASLRCPADTAADMKNHCHRRLQDIDVDLTFAELAQEVWRERPGHEELASLIDALIAEQHRHAKVMETLTPRFVALATADHEHHTDLEAGQVDPARVRYILFTLPEDRAGDIDRQISTESDRR
jgi:hypothetical protein